MGGVDARDFIRGSRPWSQFLNYCEYLIENVDGCALWAGQLNDERFLPMIEQRLRDIRKTGEQTRPSLTGYSREVDGLHRVATELRMLRAEIGKWGTAPPILGPVFPTEKIQNQWDAQEVSDLSEAIEAGHRNWKEAKQRAGI
jgi:hypothetical protein